MHNIQKAFIQLYTCLIIALFVWYSVNIIRFPYGVDYGEAPLMDQARRIENRDVLYKSNLNTPPYTVTNYPPLYPSLVATVNSALKIPLFQAGRITSIIFSIVSGYIIGLFAHRLTANRWLGVFSSALFWGHPYVINWSPLARVDLMALAFSLLGLWILFRYRDSRIGLALAILCFIVSVYTRQTYVLSGPLAGLLWLWHNSRKQAVIFILSLGGIGLGIFIFLNAITQGGFYTNIIVSNVNQYSFRYALSWAKEILIIWPIIIILSAFTAFLMGYVHLKKSVQNREHALQEPFVLYGLFFFSIGAFISAATVGKIGSNVNYFLELIAVCVIWAALGIKILIGQKSKLYIAIQLIIFLQAMWIFTYDIQLNRVNITDLREKREVRESLVETVSSAVQKGTVLSDDFMDLILLAGQPVYYQPFEYGELYGAGLWDPTKLINQINDRDFPLILVGGQTMNKDCCWPPPVINALYRNYQINTVNSALVITPLK